MVIPTAEQVHVWQISLLQNEDYFLSCLQPDEILRADRFHFPQHRRRFIVARGVMRHILARYSNLAPSALSLSYQAKGKPFLLDSALEFNLSHSDEIALLAVSYKNRIGIDIEKITDSFVAGVASRYFSAQENEILSLLSPSERVKAFYHIWARKEAILKGIGEGITLLPLKFSIDYEKPKEVVKVDYKGEQLWYVQAIQVHSDFASAFATELPVNETQQFTWTQIKA